MTLLNLLVAAGIEVYAHLTGQSSSVTITFLFAGLITFFALIFFTKAFMARAWDQGYLKAVKDTKEAVALRKYESLEFEASNPYRKPIKESEKTK